MKYELVIFDLDGTLLNTLDDLAASANRALARAGFPARSTEEVRRFIGGGVSRLIHRAVPEGTPERVCEAVLSDFKRDYTENVNVCTRPYPGIAELLVRLRAAGVRTAVNSNKVDNATQLLCRAHFEGLLDMALGEVAGIPKKPAPDGARRIMEALNIAPDKALYVGDGDTDLLTAQNAGIDCAWVSWGYRRREELEGLDIPRSFADVDSLSDFILDA